MNFTEELKDIVLNALSKKDEEVDNFLNNLSTEDKNFLSSLGIKEGFANFWNDEAQLKIMKHFNLMPIPDATFEAQDMDYYLERLKSM
jgi:hypothetical protein